LAELLIYITTYLQIIRVYDFMPNVCPVYADTMVYMQRHWLIVESTIHWSSGIHSSIGRF